MNTELVAKQYQILKEVDSTNTALKELASQQNLPEGFCLLSDYQRLGRGQYGKQWDSKAGENLLMSLFLRPNFLPAAESYRLTMSVCLAMHDLGRHYNLETQIKWPNDWYHGKKKLAGVLAESNLRGNYLENCIIGIGINVSQKNFPHPQASSLALALERDIQPMAVFEQFAECLDRRYLQLKMGQTAAQVQQFNALLYGREEWVPVLKKGEKAHLRCLEVFPSGALKVRWKNGFEETIRHQEITFLMTDEI
ncbi:MAG: biotin--[acetyl-CoA-carboxylase] ligase [Croceimicrobium sp.]